MTNNDSTKTKTYFTAMGAYWLVFGLITIFYPKLMDMFQTEIGVSEKTAFSDHVWLHGGFDIVALCVLLFALSRESVSHKIIKATAIAALMSTIAITYSIIATPYWSLLFIGAGLGCFAFAIWGFILARKTY
jgi:hypothetical protein